MRLFSDRKDLSQTEILIEPTQGWRIVDWQELANYRDLFYFLVWRDIKVLYAQTILGFLWALLNPLIQIVLFSVIFGRVAKVPTEGIPYVLFATVAIIPWTYMSEAMSKSSESLVAGQNMLGKVYFPRLIYPLVPIAAKLVDFTISLVLLLGVVLFFGVTPTWNLLLLPFCVVLMILVPAAIGFWLSALAIRYRDVRFAMTFMLKMLMYTAPIVYSAEAIPEAYRIVYSLNPLVGVIEGYRTAILGTPLNWEFILPGFVTGILLFITGAMYFRRMERIFADVI